MILAPAPPGLAPGRHMVAPRDALFLLTRHPRYPVFAGTGKTNGIFQ
jgi:hypothetical protein